MKPDHLALLLITNVTGEHLSLGNYHVYRGILNALGNDMLSVFTRAVDAMLRRGYHSKDDAEEDLKWVHQQISCGFGSVYTPSTTS